MFTKLLNAGLIGMSVLTAVRARSTVKEMERLNRKLDTLLEPVMYRVDYIPAYNTPMSFDDDLRKLSDDFYTL